MLSFTVVPLSDCIVLDSLYLKTSDNRVYLVAVGRSESLLIQEIVASCSVSEDEIANIEWLDSVMIAPYQDTFSSK